MGIHDDVIALEAAEHVVDLSDVFLVDFVEMDAFAAILVTPGDDNPGWLPDMVVESCTDGTSDDVLGLAETFVKSVDALLLVQVNTVQILSYGVKFSPVVLHAEPSAEQLLEFIHRYQCMWDVGIGSTSQRVYKSTSGLGDWDLGIGDW